MIDLLMIEAGTMTCYVCNTRKNCKRYRVCRICRDGGYDECPDCGKDKRPRSKRCAECNRKLKGADHAAWKGGRVLDSKGYVKIWCPDHPNALNSRYVWEHRLVMERILGRYILPGENVHHINGNRVDNRPENLELWVVSQPRGQRKEDLVTWAHEILERYAN